MLQTIRERTQGWIAGTIIGTIILTFAFWGIHSYFVGGGVNTEVAAVNGVDVSKEQLAVAYERLRRQNQVMYGNNSPLSKDETNLKAQALQNLVNTEVLKQASISQGFLITDHQVDNFLQSMPEFQADGQFSLDRFQSFLSSTMFSTSEFLEMIRTSSLIDQPKLGIVLSSFALPDEIESTMALLNQERDVNYVDIPVSYFLAQPLEIEQAQIQAYYDAHKKDFMTPEQVVVEYVELSLKDLSTKITPNENELKSFFNENINAYTQPTQWKVAGLEIPVAQTATTEEAATRKQQAEAMLASLKAGKDNFAVLAKTYPTQLTDKDKWVSLSQVSGDLQKAIADMSQPGQLSELIKTNNGYAILQLIAIQPPQMQTFEAVKQKVHDAYVHQHAEEKFAEMRDELADVTYKHPESLQSAAKLLNLPIKTSEEFGREKAGKDISQYKKVRDTAFSNDVMELQNNSDVIQLNPETVIVLRVKSHVASTLLPLSNLSQQIADKLKTQAYNAKAERFAMNIREQLAKGANPERLLSEQKLTWKQAGMLGRYSNKVDNAILDLAFRMPNPATTNQGKPTFGVTRIPNGYAVVMLKEVKKGIPKDEKQYSVFAEQLQQSDGMLEYELYKQSQVAAAKIVISNQQ